MPDPCFPRSVSLSPASCLNLFVECSMHFLGEGRGFCLFSAQRQACTQNSAWYTVSVYLLSEQANEQMYKAPKEYPGESLLFFFKGSDEMG